MIKGVIFDCFGVVKADGLWDVYRKFGGDPDKDRAFIVETCDAVDRGLVPSSIPIFAEHFGIDEGTWWQAMQAATDVDYELLAYVTELRKTYKTAMLSNISRGGLLRHFEAGLLEQYFDAVVGSGDIGFAKPEAQAYEITADRLGVRLDECVMIDDRQPYVDGAVAVGIQAILFAGLPDLKRELGRILAKP